MEKSYYNSENNHRISSRTIGDLKADARENLLGQYGKIICATLIIALAVALLNAIFSRTLLTQSGFIPQLIHYIALILINMLAFLFEAGVYSMHLKAARKQQFDFHELLFALKNEPNRFLIAGLIWTLISFIYQIPFNILSTYQSIYIINLFKSLGLQLPAFGSLPDNRIILTVSLITVIACIVCIWLMLVFSLVPFLLIDHPNMNAKTAFRTSRTCMRGNKRRLFILYISFIGLFILGIISLGIGYLWIIPYLKQSLVIFYQDIIGENKSSFQDNCDENAYHQEYRPY